MQVLFYRYHWMFNATAYNHAYGDTGLFCVHAASPPARIYDTTIVIARELGNMIGKVGEMELRVHTFDHKNIYYFCPLFVTKVDTDFSYLQRAKTQLQSMLLMNLEARPVVFEDVGRQVLATGKRKPPSFFINEIGEKKNIYFGKCELVDISYKFRCGVGALT